jgi:7-cyano-7-deazaguanine synthase in queuosine biosynthesis
MFSFIMKVICMFSGGLDSTFLLLKTLEDNHEVYPVYVDAYIDGLQKKLEIQQSHKIIDILKKRFSRLHSLTTVPITTTASSYIALNQPPIWLLGAMLALNDTTMVDEVRIGYVLGDQAIAYIDDIKKLWKALMSFIKVDYLKLPKVTFPYKKWSKSDIYSCLDHDISSEVSWCESPKEEDGKFVACGHCHSCKVMEEWTGVSSRTYEIGDPNEIKIKARLRGPSIGFSDLLRKSDTKKAKNTRPSRGKASPKKLPKGRLAKQR